MSPELVAVALAGAAAWCATAVPGPARRVATITGRPGRKASHGSLRRPGVGSGRPSSWRRVTGRGSPPVVGAAAGAVVALLLSSPAGGVVAAAGTASALRAVRARAADRSRRAGADDVRRLLRGLAVELRSGAPPPTALQRAWAPSPSGRPPDGLSVTGGSTAGAAHRTDQARLLLADAPAWLRAAAGQPGRESLRRLAALWDVADATGAGLADGVDRLVAELDEERELRREVDTVLAGPRASARLMAGLPLMGVLLGTGLGGDPAGFLLHDPLGQGCLLAGTALVLGGLRWTRALADAAAGTGRALP